MLMTVRGGVTAMLQTVAKGGVLYLGSHYGLSSGTWRWWDRQFGDYAFATGPSGKPVASQRRGLGYGLPAAQCRWLGWRPPTTLGLDEPRKGWTSVAAACESRDDVVAKKHDSDGSSSGTSCNGSSEADRSFLGDL
ncbi:hypothetical protein CGC21_2630 [Leishmania donovani]|uniref:Uncharacterized protein n=1 Tax=Leishmania donovani TaxID=5661 RepID=A0A504XW00_LEIDO|nr:hypothetical protein CGC21_2630 [Leishmania donovani]